MRPGLKFRGTAAAVAAPVPARPGNPSGITDERAFLGLGTHHLNRSCRIFGRCGQRRRRGRNPDHVSSAGRRWHPPPDREHHLLDRAAPGVRGRLGDIPRGTRRAERAIEVLPRRLACRWRPGCSRTPGYPGGGIRGHCALPRDRIRGGAGRSLAASEAAARLAIPDTFQEKP